MRTINKMEDKTMEENNQDVEEYLAIGFEIEQPTLGEVIEQRSVDFFEAAIPNPEDYCQGIREALGTIEQLE